MPAEVSPLAWFGFLVGAGALFNFLSLPIARGVESGGGDAIVFLGSIAMGTYAAQLGIATLWLTFGPGPFYRRLLLHWAVGFVLFASWGLGFAAALGSDGPRIEEVWSELLRGILCGLPLVSLAAQLPLWVMRIYGGWRIERLNGGELGVPQPLLIRDFLAGMVVTSASLAALRLFPQELSRDADFWVSWAIASVAVAGLSAFSLLPAIYFLLRLKEPAAGGLAWFGYTGAMLFALLIIAAMFSGDGPPGEVMGVALFVLFTFAALLSVPLFKVRALGYRLVFPGDVRQESSPLTAAPPAAAGLPEASANRDRAAGADRRRGARVERKA
jgi:hypothetical protein